MSLTKYAGSDLNRVPSEVGTMEAVSTANDQALTVSGGTSFPIKECLIYAAISNIKLSYVSFASANVSRCIPIPMITAAAILSTCAQGAPLKLAVDDLNKIWVYIVTSGDAIEVLWRR